MAYTLDQLDIIGCREIPAVPFLPRLLTPVFAVRGTDTVLMPPYSILPHWGVFDPVVTTQAEFEDLCVRERLQSIPARAARPDNQLYLDTDGAVCYEHRDRVAAKMAEYSREYWSSAQAALLAGDSPKAVLDARIARSANPTNIEPLLLQAAALKRMGQDSEARVCRTFALTRMAAETFEQGVSQWLAKSSCGQRAKFAMIATVKSRDFQLA